MPQYLIIGKDGTDSEAMERRMTVRPLHLEGARNLKANNNYIVGGATLDTEGKMTGSVMLVQFETEEALKQWLDFEPYVTGDVWQQIEIKPFKVAEL